MKFIKCLRKHNYSAYIGVVVDTTKDIEFYTVIDIIQNMSYLFTYKVLNIRAVNGKLAVGQHESTQYSCCKWKAGCWSA